MGTDVDSTDKVAIIGIGCRMPPNANSPAAFWRFLLRGGNALRAVKKDRWDWRQFWDEDQKRPGKTYAPKGAYLDADIQQFDPLVFGISPREASGLDPQQRLLLESAWEAFEDAGLPLDRVSGSATAVFIGAFCLDHLILQARPSNRHLLNANSPAAATMTVLSNRLSHVFNLKGPSLTLDTACSSSVVALHYACRSVLSGEAEMALAGGVNVMSLPDNPIMMSKGHFLSHHGECHTFDETAAGYARGEGAGVFLLKRYDHALAAGDPIHAVICASGVNQDGHTDGISLPNSLAQEALVREVYQRAGVSPAEIDYIEAHGTGTQAGDPAELRALNVNFAPGRERKLWVGSVKSNIGHLEAAAGVAGLLKLVGVLKNRQIPKNLHFKKPNPRIPFDEYNLQVVRDTTTLPSRAEKPVLYAGLNSFGYGGTNAHLVVHSAPEIETPSAVDTGGLRLISLSARSEPALRDLAGKFAFQLGQGLPGTLADLAYTTAFRRSHLETRCVAMASNLETLREQLIALSTGQMHEGVVTGAAGAAEPLTFVYTGMGPQWWAMGHELFRDHPIARETLEEVDRIFQPLAGWSLKEAMLADEASSRMERTEVAQPANFVIQLALTRIWESYGVRPAAVVGHSVGEVTSAFVAGVYSLEDAVKVSYHRSQQQQRAAGLGAMLAVGLPEAEALAAIGAREGVSVAAINSFQAVTLSGDSAQLKEIAAELEARGIFNRFLRVEVAYHSPQMDPLRDALLASLADLAPQSARLPLYSTVHGRIIPGQEWTAAYWWQNVRQPVRFAAAMQALFEDGHSAFLEIGPHPVLGNSIKECAAFLEKKVTCHVSLRRKEPELPRLLSTLAGLYCAGYTLDWTVLAPTRGRFIPGPQYPWQRERFWLESEESRVERQGLPGPVYLNRPVLGLRPAWEVEINKNYFPFLFDHGVQNQTVFAGMGYIEAALTLNRRVNETEGVLLENVSFERVLIVDAAKLQYLVSELDPEENRFVISSRVVGEEGATRQCRGRVLPQTAGRSEMVDLAAARASCPRRVELDAFYDDLSHRGLHYGPAFRPTSEVWVGEDCFFIKIDHRAVQGEIDHALHPTLFDAAIQPVLFCARPDRLLVPFAIEEFAYFSRPEADELYAFGRLLRQTETMIVADVWLADAAGRVHARATRMSCQRIETGLSAAEETAFYTPEWRAAPAAEAESAVDASQVALVTDPRFTDPELVDAFTAALPGAEEVSLEAETFPAERRNWIVLAGTREAEAFAELPEAVVLFLQRLARAHSAEVDLTFVTRRARSLDPGDRATNLAALPLGGVALLAENEFENFQCRTIDLAETPADFAVAAVLREIATGSQGDLAYRHGLRFESVLGTRKESATESRRVRVSLDEPVELAVEGKGRFDALGFRRTERVAPGAGEVELRVLRAGLTHRDILKFEGKLHPLSQEMTFTEDALGIECYGEVTRVGPGSRFAPGDQVLALVRGGFRSYALAPEALVAKAPENLGPEAAAVPWAYLTAARGLLQLANLQPGERVLVHHGSGGVGLAAIDIARRRGAEVFATAGSEEKRAFLTELGVRHVFSSRDLDFVPGVRAATGGTGIDVVFGAQSSPATLAGLSLLRPGGRYIETGRKDSAEDNNLPLRAFHKNILFASVDIDVLALERPDLVGALLAAVVEHFARGDFQLAAVETFPVGDLPLAFERLSQARHVGKLLVDFAHGEVEVSETEQEKPLVRPDGSYLVTGGTAGFGLMTGRWLLDQGAGKVLLLSRSGPKAPGLAESLAPYGDRVEALSVDVTDPAQVRAAVEKAGASGLPLAGIVHAAMVLEDAMLADVTPESFRRVYGPKALGAWNLLQAAPEGLDFFVLYSSISSVIGNRGQTSYVAANSFLDGLAHAYRDRMPIISINWGALAESGVVARDERLGAVLAASGITGLTDEQAFRALERALRGKAPQVGAFAIDWARWHEAHPKLANDPRFREQRIQASSAGGEDVGSLIRQSLAEASKEQRLKALEDHLQEVLAATLRMAKESVSVSRKLNEMGVDSLMVLELSLGIKERIGVSFSAMEFLKGPNLQQLAVMAEGKLWNN